MNRSKFSIFFRATAITLLTAVVFYLVGFRVVYSIIVHEAKQDASTAISNHENIKEITLSAGEYNALQWTEKSKEFTLNKELFDIVSVQKAGDSYILKVYTDKNETEWVDVMNDFGKWVFSLIQNMLNTFEKGYNMVQKVRIAYTPKEDTVKYHHIVDSIHSLSKDSLWHPPASC
jgi:hypothetical protein